MEKARPKRPKSGWVAVSLGGVEYWRNGDLVCGTSIDWNPEIRQWEYHVSVSRFCAEPTDADARLVREAFDMQGADEHPAGRLVRHFFLTITTAGHA